MPTNHYTDYELASNREGAYHIGLADAMRTLLAEHPDAFNVLVRTYPAAVRYMPMGSRSGEEKPRDRGEITYRGGEVLYWRPGNSGHANSVWRVPT